MRKLALLTLALNLTACGDSPSEPPDPGPPAALDVVSGAAQADTVTRELSDPVVVVVRDANGLPVPNVLINFVVTAGGGSVFAGSALTNSDGQAQEIWTLGTEAGEQSLEARAVDQATGEPIVFATVTANALPDRPRDIILARNLAALWIGERTTLPSVSAFDAHGNQIPNPAVSWTASPTDTVWTERDSVWATTEVRGFVAPSIEGQEEGGQVDRLDVVALFDLRTLGWEVEWACLAGWRDDKDSISVSLQVDSIEYAGRTSQGNAEGTWWLSGTSIQWWADGTSDTLVSEPGNTAEDGVTRVEYAVNQRVGALDWWFDTASESDGAPVPTYTGGNLCPVSEEYFLREVVIRGIER